MNPHHRNHNARGVTLVELLVVVTILMMLAAFAIPVVRPLTEGRRVREATRAVDVFLTQAKTRAIVNQRPAGVLFQRMTQTDLASGNPVYQDDACNVLRMVEVPSPYAGDLSDSRVRVQNCTFLPSGAYYHRHPDTNRPQIVLKLIIQVNDFSSDLLIKRGDRIQLNYQGPFFSIFNDPNDDNPSDPTDVGRDFRTMAEASSFDPAATDYLVFSEGVDTNTDGWIDSRVLALRADATDLVAGAWPTYNPSVIPPAVDAINFYIGSNIYWSADLPFQIQRQPEPSPIPPLKLPKDTVIDLADSGYFDTSDSAAFSSAGLYPDAFGLVGTSLVHQGPMVLFAPTGAISDVYHWDTSGNYGRYPATRSVFLMVGKWERTGVASTGPPVRSNAEDGLHNWQDASNLWMAISSHNGMVTTAEVNAPAVTTTGISVPGDPDETDRVALAAQMQVSRALARQAQISKGALEE